MRRPVNKKIGLKFFFSSFKKNNTKKVLFNGFHYIVSANMIIENNIQYSSKLVLIIDNQGEIILGSF